MLLTRFVPQAFSLFHFNENVWMANGSDVLITTFVMIQCTLRRCFSRQRFYADDVKA